MYQPNCPSWMRDPPEAYVPGLHPPTSGYPPGTMPRRGPAVVERTAQEYTYTDYRGSHTTQETHTYLNGRGVGRTFGTCHQPPPRVRSQSSHPAPSRHPERERQSSSCRGQEYIATETQHERPDDGYRRPRASHEGPPPRPQPRPPPNAYERHRPSREQEHRGRPEGSSRYREAPRARSQSRAHGGSGSRRSEEPPEQSSHRQRRSSPSARAPPGPNRDPRRSGHGVRHVPADDERDDRRGRGSRDRPSRGREDRYEYSPDRGGWRPPTAARPPSPPPPAPTPPPAVSRKELRAEERRAEERRWAEAQRRHRRA